MLKCIEELIFLYSGGENYEKIMIVEDDKDICRELKEMLDHAGYEGVVLSDFHNGCR